MFQRILMPVDLTDTHQQSLRIAATLAKHEPGEVTLLHVIEPIQGMARAEEQDFYDRLEASAQDQLGKLGSALAEQRIPWKGRVLYGSRAAEIARYASDQGIDLIVLSSHRVELDRPGAGWGTLSYKIGILAPCPVLLVK